MSVRIEIVSEPQVVVRVAGSLSGSAVAQLRTACEPIAGAFVLDFSDLRYADTAGIDLIRTLRDGGTEVHGASEFVRLLLNDGPG